MAQAAAGSTVAVMGAKIRSDNAAYENSVYEANARSLERMAEQTIEKGKKDESAYRQQVAQMVGTQRVSMAASGVDLASSTAMAIQQETAYMGATDARNISHNAYLEATGYRTQAYNQRQMGTAKLMNAQTESTLSIATAGISGLSRYKSKE